MDGEAKQMPRLVSFELRFMEFPLSETNDANYITFPSLPSPFMWIATYSL